MHTHARLRFPRQRQQLLQERPRALMTRITDPLSQFPSKGQRRLFNHTRADCACVERTAVIDEQKRRSSTLIEPFDDRQL